MNEAIRQKNPFSVRKIRVRNSGAGNGCANFMDAFVLPFPRILGVPRREKPLLFSGVSLAFFQKSKGWRIRENLVSVKCLSAILGPEMGAPILWTPGKMRPFCRKSHVHRIPRLRGGGILGFGGGGECRFYFYGREDFSERRKRRSPSSSLRWETDFYTPPVLGGAALLLFSAPAVYKNQGP